MHHVIGVILAILLFLFGMAFYNQAQAERIEAEARAERMIIQAQAQANLTQAQATAILLASTVPLILVGGGVLFFSLIGLATVIFAFNYRSPRPQQQVMYLPTPSTALPRREMWQMLSQKNPVIIEQEVNYE